MFPPAWLHQPSRQASDTPCRLCPVPQGWVEEQLKLLIHNLCHSGPAGTLSSFNFDGMARNQYGRNLKYSICIERPNDDCEVRQKLVQMAGQASIRGVLLLIVIHLLNKLCLLQSMDSFWSFEYTLRTAIAQCYCEHFRCCTPEILTFLHTTWRWGRL